MLIEVYITVHALEMIISAIIAIITLRVWLCLGQRGRERCGR